MNPRTRALAVVLGLVVVGAPVASALVKKPDGPELKSFVRIEMGGSPCSPGFSAAVPVDCGPVLIVHENQKTRYESVYLPKAFFDACELKQRGSRWVAVAKGSQVPVHLFESTFPAGHRMMLKGILRGANPSAYNELNLDGRLEVLGIAAWGPKGQDLSDVLRIPIRTSATSTISRGYEVICNVPFASPDPGKFNILNGDMPILQRMDSFGLGGDADGYRKPMCGSDPNFAKGLHAMADGEIGDYKACQVTMRFCGARLGFQGLKPKFRIPQEVHHDFGDQVKGPRWKGRSTFRLGFWGKSDSGGFSTVSSFSVPSTKTATDADITLYLTPMTIFNHELTCLALRREMVRSLRTLWLIKGSNLPRLIPAVYAADLHEALLRSTVPMWELFANDNALRGLEGVDAYRGTPQSIKDSYSDAYIKAREYLVRPPSGKTGDLDLADCYKDAYPAILDEPCDHRYASAVYASWQDWDMPKPAKAIDTLVAAMTCGYSRATSSMDTTTATNEYFGTTSAAALTATYGISPQRFRCTFTDFEWVAQATMPTTSTGAAIPTTGTTMAQFIYPFHHLADNDEGKRLVSLIRGETTTSGNTPIPPDGVVAVDWGGWSAKPGTPNRVSPREYALLGFDKLVADIERVCTSYVGDYTPSSSSKYTYVTTWANDSDAGAGTNTTTRMASRLATGIETQVAEAQACFCQLAMRRVGDEKKRLTASLAKPVVSRLRIIPDTANSKLTMLVEDRCSFRPTGATTVTSPGAVLVALTRYMHDFVDRVKYKQAPSVQATNSVKDKNVFLSKLAKEVFVKADAVPASLLKRYLADKDFGRHRMLFSLSEASRIFGAGVRFYRRTKHPGAASTVDPFTIPALP